MCGTDEKFDLTNYKTVKALFDWAGEEYILPCPVDSITGSYYLVFVLGVYGATNQSLLQISVTSSKKNYNSSLYRVALKNSTKYSGTKYRTAHLKRVWVE